MMHSQRDIGRVSVVTAAAVLPLSVVEAKDHLRIDQDAEDTEIQRYIETAVNEIAAPRGWLGRSITPQTLRLTLDGPPPDVIYLPGPPVTQVKTIKTRGSDDTFTTAYDVDAGPIDTIGLITDLTAEPALIWPDDNIGWPTDIKGGPDTMRIEYVAGYADAASVPDVIRSWIAMRVGELYRDRDKSILGTVSNRLHHADQMLENWRVRC